MQYLCAYQIQVQGTVDENAFNATSPLHVKVVDADPDTALFKINADQSGLIGLLRYLHQQGYVLLSVYRS